ncbi:PAS domain-containing sensor histidine kinase [Methanoculleus caldifontis]|nr:PAS domain S-box protein [Methanoculleus sp. Wushi-C6]
MMTRTMRRRTSPRLRAYMQFLADATEIVSCGGEEDGRIQTFIRRLGRTAGASSACFAEIVRIPETGGVCLRVRYEWVDGEGQPRGEGRSLSCGALPPGSAEELAAGRPVVGLSTPALAVPVFFGSGFQGALVLYGPEGRAWHRFEIDAVWAAAGILGSIAISRSGELDPAGSPYRVIVEDLTDPLCRLSPDGRIVYANRLFCSLCSRRPDEMVGMPVLSVLPPDIAKNFSVPADLPGTENPVVTHEFRVGGGGSAERWYRSVCRVVLNGGGAVCGYQVVGHDITERKRWEVRNRRMNDQRLALLADAASDAIVVIDDFGSITYWNCAAGDLFGYPAKEMVGRDVSILFPPGYFYHPYVEGVRQAVAAASGRVLRLRFSDVMFARKQGSVFPADLSIAAVRTGDEWYSVGIIHDTTVQRAREQALHEEMERTGTLLRIASRLSGSIALDAVLDALCEEAARALRAPAAVVFLSDTCRDLLVPARSFGVPEDARDYVPCVPLEIYERELSNQGSVFVIGDLVSRTGEVIREGHLEDLPRTLVSAAIFHEGTLIGSLNLVAPGASRSFSPEELALLKGIADQAALAIVNARLFEERRAYERRLQASLEEKTALLKEVHHRVKNNMQVISSLLSLQGRLIENAAARECIRESGNRVKSLVLVHEDLYRSESFSAVDIGAYTRRLAGDLVLSYDLQDSVSVAVETAGGVTVSGDTAIPIGLILNELISNSLKHGFAGRDRGAIVVRIALLPDCCLTIDYRDDGVGMSPEIIDQPPATLGLQLVRVLAAQVGGTIDFRRGDPGTVVEIIVPDNPANGRKDRG